MRRLPVVEKHLDVGFFHVEEGFGVESVSEQLVHVEGLDQHPLVHNVLDQVKQIFLIKRRVAHLELALRMSLHLLSKTPPTYPRWRTLSNESFQCINAFRRSRDLRRESPRAAR